MTYRETSAVQSADRRLPMDGGYFAVNAETAAFIQFALWQWILTAWKDRSEKFGSC